MAYSMRLALPLLRAAASRAFAALSIEKNGRKLISSCLSKNCLIPSLAGAWRKPVRACTEFLNSSSCWVNSALLGFSPRSCAFCTTSPNVGAFAVGLAGVGALDFGALAWALARRAAPACARSYTRSCAYLARILDRHILCHSCSSPASLQSGYARLRYFSPARIH